MSAQAEGESDDVDVIFYCRDDNREYLKGILKQVTAIGITAWDISVFEAIWYDYGQVQTKEHLARRAFCSYVDKFPAKATATIEKCFDKRWIQFLTNDFLEQMHQELIDGGYLMPNGLVGRRYRKEESPVGLISFTQDGVSKLCEYGSYFGSESFDHHCVDYQSDGCLTVYGETIDACEEFLTNEEFIIEREPAVEIGRWCDRWWLRFEHGFRICYRVNEERHQ